MKNSSPSRQAVFIIVHWVAWLIIFVACQMALSNFIPDAVAWKRAFFIVGLSVVVFYVHANLLINCLLERNKDLLYFIALILLMVLAIAIRYVVDKYCTSIALPVNLAKRTPSKNGFIFLPTLLAVGVSALYQLLLNRYNRERQYLLQINELSKAQLAFLKNQINPHFLFNHLNNIYSLIVTGASTAGDAVLKLSDLLRYVIYKSEAEKVSIEEECMQISNLIELFRLKDEEQHVTFDRTGVRVNAWIEPMLLIPLVENCFKHCNDLGSPVAYIAIAVSTDPQWMTFTTENTTVLDKLYKGEGGVGLANIKKRLAHVYGADNYEFTCMQNGNKFQTKLKLRWKRSSPVLP